LDNILQLICHPDNPPKDVESIEVAVSLSAAGEFWVRYHVEIPEESLVIGESALAERTHGLWNSTCFEAFLRFPGQNEYLEFNFAPSSQWAAFQFKNYREGATDYAMDVAPEIGLDCSNSHFALEAELQLSPEWCDRPVEISLTAIIEETGGCKSYWALYHGNGEPDFHQSDCFRLTLAAGVTA
jgi:hypothetical protein